ncbi:MAG TPA: T9SS type A sorting domain-containing protein, partial [Paludibacter sp.]
IDYGKLFPVVYELDYINNGGNDFKFLITEAARCIISLDLVSLKISVQKESQNSTENLKLGEEISIAANDGKIVVKSSSSVKKNFSVFTIDGRKIHSNSFVYDSEISLPKGYYIVKITDGKGKQCQKTGILN